MPRVFSMIQVLFWVSAFCLIYSYAVYPLILLFIDKFNRSRTRQFRPFEPGVTIIIAAYNEEKVIGRKIENCLKLDYPQDKMEVIIASDGSTDKTAEITRSYESSGVRLLDFPRRRGKVNVLNEAVEQARKEIIVFSDANTIFAPGAIKKLVRNFSDEEVGAVCGALEFVNAEGSRTGELEGIYWRFETFLKRIEGSHGALLGANGAIYAIHKSLFERCPPDTIVEDFVLPMKIMEKGYRVVYEPQAFATEEAAAHIIQEKKRRIRIGAGDFQSLGMLKSLLNPMRGFPAFAFWSHKVLRWFAPLFLIAAFMTNALLIKHPLYALIFLVQCMFYISAIIGQILSWSGRHIRFFSLCYYFVSMNIALLLGLGMYLTGKHNVKWNRTER